MGKGALVFQRIRESVLGMKYRITWRALAPEYIFDVEAVNSDKAWEAFDEFVADIHGEIIIATENIEEVE